MIKLNYTVSRKYPRNPRNEPAPEQTTELAEDLKTWCKTKVSELMCLLGNKGFSQEINIKWDRDSDHPTLVLTYNVGSSAEVQRTYRIDGIVSV